MKAEPGPASRPRPDAFDERAIRREMFQSLFTRQPKAIGCVRREVWTADAGTEDDPAWWRKLLRGNAVLAALGHRTTIRVPASDSEDWVFDVFLRGPLLLAFRAGTERAWWVEDVQLTLALLDPEQVRGALLVHELDGVLSLRYIPRAPEEGNLRAELRKRWQAFRDRPQTPPRLARDSERARAQCPFCPVRAACEAADLVSNDTADWPDELLVRYRRSRAT